MKICIVQNIGMSQNISELINGAGGVTEVARQLDRKVGTVSAWMARNRVPAEEVIRLAKVVNVDPHIINPVLYPTPTPAAE